MKIGAWMDKASRDIRMTSYAGLIFWMAFSAFAGVATALFYPEMITGPTATNEYDYLIEDCH